MFWTLSLAWPLCLPRVCRFHCKLINVLFKPVSVVVTNVFILTKCLVRQMANASVFVRHWWRFKRYTINTAFILQQICFVIEAKKAFLPPQHTTKLSFLLKKFQDHVLQWQKHTNVFWKGLHSTQTPWSSLIFRVYMGFVDATWVRYFLPRFPFLHSP